MRLHGPESASLVEKGKKKGRSRAGPAGRKKDLADEWSACEHCVDLAGKRLLRLRPDDARDHFAVLENHDGRDAHDAVARGRALVVVCVELSHLELAIVLA